MNKEQGNKNRNYRLKGFTIAEVLVVLALTSLSITISYGTLTYIQKLFTDYRRQNTFLTQYTDLKKRLDYESLKASVVTEESENRFIIRRDSSETSLEILEKAILLKRNARCDTFHLTARNIRKEYETMKNPAWTNRLLKSLQFEVEYTRQKFFFYFYKAHETSVKLKLDEEA